VECILYLEPSPNSNEMGFRNNILKSSMVFLQKLYKVNIQLYIYDQKVSNMIFCQQVDYSIVVGSVNNYTRNDWFLRIVTTTDCSQTAVHFQSLTLDVFTCKVVYFCEN
jgi:hypothetical protein